MVQLITKKSEFLVSPRNGFVLLLSSRPTPKENPHPLRRRRHPRDLRRPESLALRTHQYSSAPTMPARPASPPTKPAGSHGRRADARDRRPGLFPLKILSLCQRARPRRWIHGSAVCSCAAAAVDPHRSMATPLSLIPALFHLVVTLGVCHCSFCLWTTQ